jgi:hypothetical protein
MPFTTLQDRALQIPRQTYGGQYPRAKFNLGEVHTILPPVGCDVINCQGFEIRAGGKKLQITKELVALIQAGFVRIAVDLVGPDADKHSAPIPTPSPPPPIVTPDPEVSKSTEGNTESHVLPTGVSSLDLGGVNHAAPPTFSSVEEIQACDDREKIRLYVFNITTYPNDHAPIEGLKDLAMKLFRERSQT